MSQSSLFFSFLASFIILPSVAIAACQDIANDADRLKCYDAAFRNGVSTFPDKSTIATSSTAANDTGAWTVEETTDHLSKQRKVIFYLQSDRAQVFSDPFAQSHNALLILTCDYKKPNLIFAFTKLVAGSRGVSASYRIGEPPVKSSRWKASQDNKAFGPWDSPEAAKMIAAMLGSEDMVVRSDAETFGSTEATYRLAGLKNISAKYPGACGRP
ncbi:type VI secretion system (T6SS) VasI/EvfG family protein [Methylosinus sp. sav-2]|uniref:type VI secretion system-associated protein TagO n=1 Tax=Methylosinus sp. sav-2 TaxID=2485168 RepID=UPI000A02B611|nr:type VI secretion system-associated protein TagO [Methylosinus sp. sav-2]TDX64023.1 type VI secretion system (T6SS) VasI/EvfG family protein [Methylosinus sp. sav-2]